MTAIDGENTESWFLVACDRKTMLEKPPLIFGPKNTNIMDLEWTCRYVQSYGQQTRGCLPLNAAARYLPQTILNFGLPTTEKIDQFCGLLLRFPSRIWHYR